MGRELGELGVGGVYFSLGFFFFFFLFSPRYDLLRNTGLPGSGEAPNTLTMVITFNFVSQSPQRTGSALMGPTRTLVSCSDFDWFQFLILC